MIYITLATLAMIIVTAVYVTIDISKYIRGRVKLRNEINRWN